VKRNRRLLCILCAAAVMTLPAVNVRAAGSPAGIPVVPGLISWTDENIYRVTEDTTLDERVTVSGNVTLEMAKGTTLTCEKGISVSRGNSLTIQGSGTLITDASDQYGAAGIGGNSQSQTIAGSVTINSGTVTAIGGEYGAGIGGGIYSSTGNSITINGGNVTATGGYGGAGIGGGGNYFRTGSSGSVGTITINGGTVTATGGTTGAGIGSGGGNAKNPEYEGGNAEAIIIRGGKVTATSEKGAGIGPGLNGYAEEIILGWSDAGDYIDASSITADSVRIEDEFHYYTADGTDRGEATAENLAGKEAGYVLRPFDDTRKIILPDGLEVIESEAFAGISANRVEIGGSVTLIENRAFADIAGVLTADFDNEQVRIEDGAFENTTVLILCYAGSSAHVYAQSHGIPYNLK